MDEDTHAQTETAEAPLGGVAADPAFAAAARSLQRHLVSAARHPARSHQGQSHHGQPLHGKAHHGKVHHATAASQRVAVRETRITEAYLRVLDGYGEYEHVSAKKVVDDVWSERDRAVAAKVLGDIGHPELDASTPNAKLLGALKAESDLRLEGRFVGAEEAAVYATLLDRLQLAAAEKMQGLTAHHRQSVRQLHPLLQLSAVAALREVEKLHFPHQVTDVHRDPEKQDEYVRQGTSFAPKGYSFHGLDLALDMVPTTPRNQYDWNTNHPVWGRMIAAMRKHGFRSLGHDAHWDYPHFEAPLGGRETVHLPQLPDGRKVIHPESLPPSMQELNASYTGEYTRFMEIKAMKTPTIELPPTPPMRPDATSTGPKPPRPRFR